MAKIKKPWLDATKNKLKDAENFIDADVWYMVRDLDEVALNCTNNLTHITLK